MRERGVFNIYLPREDSFLLQQFVQLYATGSVLDMGVGSGIQAFSAATKKEVAYVIGVDSNQESIDHCNKLAVQKDHQNILFLTSNLFEKIKKKSFLYDKKKNKISIKNAREYPQFNTIIFNPPYLPADEYPSDPALIGGKKGYEIIERFLQQVSVFLKKDGRILLLFSSKTKKEKVDSLIRDHLLEYTPLEEKYIGGFETLHVYSIHKTKILQLLERKGVTNIQRLAKGHRGDVFRGIWKKKKVVIKKQRDDVKIETIQNEIRILKQMNKKKIGPTLFFFEKNCFIGEYIEGIRIEEFLLKASKKDAQKVIREILTQCLILDKMQLNKEEMHHPYKHILVRKNKPVFIDFERCGYTKDPKNVTQFLQYLGSKRVHHLLREKKIILEKKQLILAAQEYKKTRKEEKILRMVEGEVSHWRTVF